MTTGLRIASGVDLDAVFDPYVQGAKPPNTGYRTSDGVDLAGRFAPLAFGSQAATTGYRLSDGADPNTLWAKIGTASYNDSVVIPFGSYTARATGSHDIDARWVLTLKPDGTWSIAQTTNGQSNSTSGTPTSGNWHVSPAAGVGSDYEIRFTADVGIDNTFTGAASPSYTASTDWLPMSVGQSVEATTTHMLGGSSDNGGNIFISGHYTVEIRRVGFAQVNTSTAEFSVEGICT
jgi:hypothetical protein